MIDHRNNGTPTVDQRPRVTAQAAGQPGPLRPLLTDVRGAATLLAISERSIFRLVKAGELPTVPIPGVRSLRFVVADLEKWVARLTEGGEAEAREK
jgi:excisionase family DNA binding protein